MLGTFYSTDPEKMEPLSSQMTAISSIKYVLNDHDVGSGNQTMEAIGMGDLTCI